MGLWCRGGATGRLTCPSWRTTCGRPPRTSPRTPTRLAAIEEEKAGLEADDPRLVELSAEGEAIARRLVPKTAAESELAAEALATDGGAA